MKKENFDQLYNDVKNGRLSIRQGVELLAQFVCENKPLFKLQCYDDDFASEMILYFLERGEKVSPLSKKYNIISDAKSSS